MLIGLGLGLTQARRAAATGGGGGGPTTIASDDFNRADTIAIGSTPVGSKAWTQDTIGGQWSGQGIQIVSNQAVARDGGVDGCWINAGVSDCTVSVTLNGTPTGGGLTVRLSDLSNFWRIYFSGTEAVIQKVVAGVVSTVDHQAATWAAGDILSVVLLGNAITVKKNGSTLVSSAADAFNSTATNHGLFSNGTITVTFDNFSVTVP